MKLLFALPYVPSLIRVRPYHFLRELSARHEIAVLAVGSGRELANGEALRAFCTRVELVPLRPLTALRSCLSGALRGEPLQAAVCRSPELERRLADLLDAERFDLAHVEHVRAAHLGARLPVGLPTLLDSVDSISLLLERTLHASHDPRQRLIAALELGRMRRYEAALFDRFERVVVTSPEDAAALRGLNRHAAPVVIPNGVDLDYFHPLEGPREPGTIVLSGKMSYHANATAALYFAGRVLPLIWAARPDARLRIIGSSPPRAVQELTRDPRVTVTGHLPDLREALGRASVAVCPVTVKVGIQNKILEAMAMGLPVVASRAGATGLQAEAGRDLLVAADPAGLARGVLDLLEDPERAEQIGRAGRRYVEAFHRWRSAADRLEELYDEIRDRAAVAAGRSRPDTTLRRRPLR